ncbi:MAG: hypothetical protein R6U70_09990 [Bacillota bacterium]
MVVAAAFSHESFMAGAAFDPIEAALHSFAATAMGFAFALGVPVRLLQRQRGACSGRTLDLMALGVAAILPMLMP